MILKKNKVKSSVFCPKIRYNGNIKIRGRAQMSEKKIKLRPEVLGEIEKILSKGNSVEIKRRKDDVIILEVKKEINNKQPL